MSDHENQPTLNDTPRASTGPAVGRTNQPTLAGPPAVSGTNRPTLDDTPREPAGPAVGRMDRLVLVDADAMLGRHPRRAVDGGGPAALLREMDRVGISEALVGHVESWLHDPRTGNDTIVRLVAGEPRLHPCWVMLPDTCGEIGTPAAFAEAALDSGVRAVRAYPADHGYDLAGADAAPMLDAVAEAGLPLLLDSPQIGWAAVEAVAAARPRLTIVVGEVGYRALRQVAGVLARTGNVHLGLANLSSHCGLEWLAERFGAERLVFGTGSLTRDPAEAVTRLLWSELDDAAVAAIGAGNLLDLLGERVNTV